MWLIFQRSGIEDFRPRRGHPSLPFLMSAPCFLLQEVKSIFMCSVRTENLLLYLCISLCLIVFCTRSYAALRAADLDWIVGPGYSLGRVHSGEKPAGISKNVPDAGSQLPWEGGGAGISKNVTDAGSQLTF